MAAKKGKSKKSSAGKAKAVAKDRAKSPEPSIASPPPPPPVSEIFFGEGEDEDEGGEEEEGEEEEEEEEATQEEEEESDLLYSLLSSGLSDLSVAVEDSSNVYCRLTLRHHQIEDISHITACPDLRHVDLSHNNISDLTPLSDIRYLITFDCSYNSITTALDFSPGYWLTVADLAHNDISVLPDLSGFWALTTLRLDFNHVQSLQGVQGCKHLRVLTASNNELRHSDGVQNLPLRTLDLSHNKIETTDLLCTLGQLRYLDLSWNRLEQLRNLHGMRSLRRVSFRANPIADLTEIDALCELPSLDSVDLRLCPVADWEFYRASVLFHLPQLTQLDQTSVSDRETVAARNAFSARPARRAAVDHAQLSALRLRRPAELAPAVGGDARLPWDALVLVGPPGSGKHLLLHGLLEKMPPHVFGKGISHTSRPRRPGESTGKQYVFVSPAQFTKLHSSGQMLETSQIFQARYGLSEAVARELRRKGLIMVTHTDLAGALSLQQRLARVQLILVLPLSEAIHRQRLEQKERTEADHMQLRWRRHSDLKHSGRPLVAEELVEGAVTPRQAELEPSTGQMTRTASLKEVTTPHLAEEQARRRGRVGTITVGQISRTQEVTSPIPPDLPDLTSPELHRKIEGLGAALMAAISPEPEGVSTSTVETSHCATPLTSASMAEGETPATITTSNLQTPTTGGTQPSTSTDPTLPAQPAALAPDTPSTGVSQPLTSTATSASANQPTTPGTGSTNNTGTDTNTCTAAGTQESAQTEQSLTRSVRFPGNSSTSVPSGEGEGEDEEEEEEEESSDDVGPEPGDILVPRLTDSLWNVQRSWLKFPLTDECSGQPQDRLTEIPSYGSFSMMDRWARHGAVPEVLGHPPYLGVESRKIWEKSEPCIPPEALSDKRRRHGADKLPAYSDAQIAAILGERDTYLSYHLQQPGLFMLAVNSDRLPQALEQLCGQLKQRLPLQEEEAAEPRWAWMERILKTQPVASEAAEAQLRQQLRMIENAGPVGRGHLDQHG